MYDLDTGRLRDDDESRRKWKEGFDWTCCPKVHAKWGGGCNVGPYEPATESGKADEEAWCAANGTQPPWKGGKEP